MSKWRGRWLTSSNYVPDKEYFMLDLERIRQMTKLASYEAGEGKTYLPISKYYRSDFIGLALI